MIISMIMMIYKDLQWYTMIYTILVGLIYVKYVKHS